jgi:hypothetical protein
MKYINKIVAQTEIPKWDDKIYTKKFKFKDASGLVDVFSARRPQSGKVLIYLFKDWDLSKHLTAASQHAANADKFSKQWLTLAKKTFKDVFGRDRETTDYKVCNIDRDEYPEDVKNKLRKISKAQQRSTALAHAHKEAAKMVNRIKVHKSPIEGSTKKGKLIREVKLKSGVNIPKDTPVEIKWMKPEENGHTVAQVIPEGFEPYKTHIKNLHMSVSGFPKPPTESTMQKWMNDGIAKTPTGQKTEPDGWGADGSPSWLLALGII